MLKLFTLTLFVSVGLGILIGVAFVACDEPRYEIRPEPEIRYEPEPSRTREARPRREPVIRADDRPMTYSPLEDM